MQRGCDPLILAFEDQDQKIAAFRSSYITPVGADECNEAAIFDLAFEDQDQKIAAFRSAYTGAVGQAVAAMAWRRWCTSR
ncbi:Uncharacterised protein [Pseudomonas fluorescens]|uniref:Uncharacterized protein n=1 Tax=Pseudomonas fluorescens TaxID=294 RepID=A0A448DTT4_PSEFL|nr:Uncharacterised protein [Pseudomonas fluorescens]